MSSLPSHTLPTFSDESRDDALFHYTTATGLIGIFGEQALWATAYYCANDEQELSAGKGVLTRIFREEVYKLRKTADTRIETFYRRGVDPFEYADKFEGLITGLTLSYLCAYMACFCKPTLKEDFHHGLLSQWRGYGPDGGYAVQLSREKLKKQLKRAASEARPGYELKDVYYGPKNPIREEVLSHAGAFLNAFQEHLDELAKPLDSNRLELRNPLSSLLHGPLESLLDYLIQTKNQHYAEECECRLSVIQTTAATPESLPVRYFERNGLLVPYVKTPRPQIEILDCVEWIIVGPGPRMNARFKSVGQLVRQSGCDIKVRVSHIPYTRL